VGLLSKDALLGATAPTERVAVSALQGDVIVRGMTGAERDAFEVSLVEGRGKRRDVNLRNMRAKLVAFCAVDEQGARLFADADADALGQTRADVLDCLYAVAARLSGITKEDEDELGKSSSLAAFDSSSSASPVN
jgi:hypothetical protein